MTSASLFLKNKYLLVLSVLVIFVAGFSAFVSMPRLEDPRIVNRNPLIVTLVPGASAERVEALVTEKLEEKLQEVSEIKELRSTSRAGVSIIAVELADRVYDSQKVFSLMRDKIAEAEPELPREASTPLLDDQRGPVAYSLIVGVVWEHDSEPKLGILNRLAEDVGRSASHHCRNGERPSFRRASRGNYRNCRPLRARGTWDDAFGSCGEHPGGRFQNSRRHAPKRTRRLDSRSCWISRLPCPHRPHPFARRIRRDPFAAE